MTTENNFSFNIVFVSLFPQLLTLREINNLFVLITSLHNQTLRSDGQRKQLLVLVKEILLSN